MKSSRIRQLVGKRFLWVENEPHCCDHLRMPLAYLKKSKMSRPILVSSRLAEDPKSHSVMERPGSSVSSASESKQTASVMSPLYLVKDKFFVYLTSGNL